MSEYATETGALIAELFEIARQAPHHGTEHYAGFLKADRPRTREIGERLYELGGHKLMEQAYYAMLEQGPPYAARHLEIAWDQIGDWRD